MDFRSGPGPTPPGAAGPVGFRTFTETELAQNWPPDMSGARGGDVVLMSGNLWLKLSVDGGKTFTDLDFTKIFAQDTVYGGWAGDQVIHYIPAIDCFVLYVQSFKGTGTQANRNVVKIALASQADLKKFSGGKEAWWRQWDFTPDTFGLGTSWMDFPDLTYGKDFLHVNTNVFVGKTGKLFFELPLADMVAGKGLSFLFAFIDDANIVVGSPAQNVTGNEFYWAQHVDNSHMRIYSSVGGDPNYAWREREVLNWPKLDDGNVAREGARQSPIGSARIIGSSARPVAATNCGSRGRRPRATADMADSRSRSRMSRSCGSTSAPTTSASTSSPSGTAIMPTAIRALQRIRTAKSASRSPGAAARRSLAATRSASWATGSSGMARRATSRCCASRSATTERS